MSSCDLVVTAHDENRGEIEGRGSRSIADDRAHTAARVRIVVRCLWKKRDHEEAVSFDDLGDPREGRSSVCRSWTVPRVVDRSR